MTKQEYESGVDRLCRIYGIGAKDRAGMNGGNIQKFVKQAYDLIGTRVSVHTNRNAHIWSILGPNGKSPVRAYALDCVFLKDVCWLPPSIGNARRTYRKMVSEGRQARTVQAFAEGVLVAVDDMPMEDFEAQDILQVKYNPMAAEWVGAFRDRSDRDRAIASSEFASLSYIEPLGEWHNSGKPAGRRPSISQAYNDIEWIPEDFDRRYVSSIITDDEGQVDRGLKKYISPSCKAYRNR